MYFCKKLPREWRDGQGRRLVRRRVWLVLLDAETQMRTRCIGRRLQTTRHGSGCGKRRHPWCAPKSVFFSPRGSRFEHGGEAGANGCGGGGGARAHGYNDGKDAKGRMAGFCPLPIQACRPQAATQRSSSDA
ncbi:hypothetical protein SORBI_3010G260900 [Sorghum bicolor]|uniref:Uncharacterized protein n=1 Tax=Sorghum bicolor TaxID=4558 RepID=A0A194YLL3_SORBI|nr:hypothetical protein SORBI_3010G260900 [Sorghum bicolor]